jgi:hypothetical protein
MWRPYTLTLCSSLRPRHSDRRRLRGFARARRQVSPRGDLSADLGACAPQPAHIVSVLFLNFNSTLFNFNVDIVVVIVAIVRIVIDFPVFIGITIRFRSLFVFSFITIITIITIIVIVTITITAALRLWLSRVRPPTAARSFGLQFRRARAVLAAADQVWQLSECQLRNMDWSSGRWIGLRNYQSFEIWNGFIVSEDGSECRKSRVSKHRLEC